MRVRKFHTAGVTLKVPFGRHVISTTSIQLEVCLYLKGHDISAIQGRFLLIFALDKLNVRHISTSALVDLLT